MKKILLKRGFTIIELLVVIAIIAVMTAIVTSNFTTAKSKARDAKRVSDIAQIQLALAMLFDKCNAYPSDITLSATVPLDSAGNPCKIPGGQSNYNLSQFISVIPKENSSTAYTYKRGGNSPFTDYVLRATLENNSTVLLDDVDGTPLSIAGGCDDNVAANGPYYYCVQPK